MTRELPHEASPLAQAEDAKRRRNIGDEITALTSAGDQLTASPWYPARPGDLVHVHYEQAGDLPPFGETYIVGDAGEHGLMSLRLLAHTLPETVPGMDAETTAAMAGCFAAEAAECPLYEAWFEAGPRWLTIVRDGRIVHDGASGNLSGAAAAGALMTARDLADAARQAQRYLERGEPELALARLKSYKPLPLCGAPGIVWEDTDCARPRGHHGAHSADADYTEPPHECPDLPEQLHAVVTVGATVGDVHFAGLYEEVDAAVDHAAGFTGYRDDLDERYVSPAPGAPGEMVLKLPRENELATVGVQLAVVVPLQVLQDPRAEDWQADERRAAADPQDLYDCGRDLDDEDDYRNDE